MKLNWFCILIVIALSCTFVTAKDSSDEDGQACLETYLQQKGKLGINFPVRQSSLFLCRFVTPITLRVVESLIENQIKEEIPNDADCLIREFKNKESLDILIKLNVIEESNLSESEIKTQTNVTRNELRQDLIKTATQCETNEVDFIAIFNEFLGIKNETLSALEHKYCFAKYAADNELLPLQNIDLNPNGIVTTYIDCKAIIKKERRQHERNAREKVKARNPEAANCVMEAYNTKNVFNTYIIMSVLDYVELPKETKDVESNLVTDKFADFAGAVMVCYMSLL